jgi:chromosomal replication initiation ATPase DnaA
METYSPTGIWAHVLLELKDHDPNLWAAWFRHLEGIERQDGVAVLSTPNAFIADYVATHLSGRLLAAYALHASEVRSVRLEVPIR